MKLRPVILLFIPTILLAADFQHGKLLDVQAFTRAGPSIVAPNNGSPVIIPTSQNMFTLTVALNDMIYSAQFRQTRHFNPAHFVVGDPIEVKVEGDKLTVRTSEGKEEKGRIVRQERPKLIRELNSCARFQSPLPSHHNPARAGVSPAGGSVAVSDWRKSSTLFLLIPDVAY